MTLVRHLPLAVALLLGLVLRVELARTAPPFLVANDSADYFGAGYLLETTGQLQIALKRTPLYSLFLAGAIGVVGPSLDRLVALQHGLGLLTIGLSYLLGWLAFGRLAAALAALATALSGALLTMEHLVISEALFTPLLLGGCCAGLAAVRDGRLIWWLAAGLLWGLGALCRPLGLAVPLLGLPLLVLVEMPRSARFRGGALLLLGVAVCLAPWLVRQRVQHEQAAINGGLGDALYSRVRRYDPTFTLRDDSPPTAEPERTARARIFELAPLYEYPRELRRELRAQLGVSDLEADHYLRNAALAVIAQDPLRYLSGTAGMLGKLLRGTDPGFVDLWHSIERDRVVQGWSPELRWLLTSERPLTSLAAFDYANALLSLYRDDLPSGFLPLALAPVGSIAALALHRRRGVALLPLLVLSQLLLYVALDGPLFRYRYPLQPLIAVLSAGGAVTFCRQLGVFERTARK